MPLRYGTFGFNSSESSFQNGQQQQKVVQRQGRNKCGYRSAIVSAGILSVIVLGALSAAAFFGGLSGFGLHTPDVFQEDRTLTVNDKKCKPGPAPLVIFSFDGFARAYLNRKMMKSFDFMAENGVKAEYMLPSFQSKTFPNHYTVATGLYPGFHGIVDARVYDSSINDTPTNVRDADQSAFYKYNGEPIWALFNRLNGGRVACFQFPGCVNYPDNKPDPLDPFHDHLSNRAVFDKVIEQIQKDDKSSSDLILVYLDEPDNTRHGTRENSSKIDLILHRLDINLQRFFATLKRLEKLECTNVIVLSDHGFMNVDRVVNLSKFGLPQNDFVITGVVTRVHENEETKTAKFLRDLPCDSQNNGFRTFSRRTLPPRLHYAVTKRAGDLLLLAEPGTILRNSEEIMKLQNLGSNHGWDYTIHEMQTIFFAMGPAFKKKTVISPFQNVELFNLFAELLGVEIPQNNGTLGALWSALQFPKKQRMDPFYENNRPIQKCSSPLEQASLFEQAKQHILGVFEEKFPIKFQDSEEMVCFEEIESDVHRVSTETGGVALIERSATVANQEESNVLLFNEPMTNEFRDKFWLPLQQKTREYRERFAKMGVITGTVDSHGDRYLYRVLHRCEDGKWDDDRWHCEDSTQTRTLAFLVPMKFADRNCLPPDELLFAYTARVKDIETISGLRFFIDQHKIPYEMTVKIKTNVTINLW
ncbi:unnamed protein product, partial [Mesorhabditis belari]|uniref:Uncharacterized protein n=1 Tax=Mesorhabditis belari TaxID=2138241 RepID=A0AAF3FJ03_9BILA